MARGKHGNHAKASNQHRWKAGSRAGSTGHIKVRVGKCHPLADPNGWTYEHLLVWVAAGNTRPTKGEVRKDVGGAITLGKARAGRQLDGQTCDQMPGVKHG